MLLFWIPALTSYLTAFYMGRLWWLTFAGKNRNEDLLEEAHESTFLTLPLIVLAGLSLGIWFAPTASGDFFGLSSLLTKSLSPDALVIRPTEDLIDNMINYIGKVAVYAPAAVGLLAALALYCTGFGLTTRIRRLPVLNLIYLWLREKMFFDALYNGIFVRAALTLAAIAGFVDRYLVDGLVNFTAFLTRSLSRLSGLIDDNLIDGLVNGLADFAALSGKGVLAPQAGRIRIYVLVLLSTLALLTLILLFSIFH